jgi:cytochrome b561/polyisoprenoid-binding protein YceI
MAETSSLNNTSTRYGSVAKTFHWLTALLILTLIPLGIIANGLPYETSAELAQKAWLFSLHKTLGVMVFFVALARIAWAFGQPKPAGLHPERKAETFLAELVHWLLYGSLLLVPLTGWIHHAATTGFVPIWWPLGQNLPFVPKSDAVAAATAGLHIVFERVLVLSILLHAAGALKHHFIDKDATLKRMWLGKTYAGTGSHTPARSPLFAALGIWAIALGTGAALGSYDSHAAPRVETELAAVQSGWQVQEGQIAIEVTQLGSKVAGQFADWTSEIDYDPTIKGGKAGTVRTVIAISSLTLGSVTDQAMSPDFFDAATYPIAVFAGDIMAGADDTLYVEGALTLRDVSMPLRLPFTLDISEGTAAMQGNVTLSRLDFNIGSNMPDESSLGFAVDVNLKLTATQAP